MEIEKIIAEIIPPSDYQHRNGFNNMPLIDQLTQDEKEQVEDALIYKLLFESDKEIDTLIVETLAYLKTNKAVSVLNKLIETCHDEVIRLIIAAAIFEINLDSKMVDIAINSFKKLSDNRDPYFIYRIADAFYQLIKFNNPIINKMIKEYINHKEYLISYNAKRALRIK